MCLSIPSKVVAIDKKTNTATVDTMGVSRDASLTLIEEDGVKVGDYVLIHIGFVMQKIDEEEALISLQIYKDVLSLLDEEELHRTVLEDDNCPNRGL